MALNTASRRNSALLDPGNMPWPPDGTIGVTDRLVMLEFYSGILASVPVEPDVPEITFIVPNVTTSFAVPNVTTLFVVPDPE